jgi:hypothetical protein
MKVAERCLALRPAKTTHLEDESLNGLGVLIAPSQLLHIFSGILKQLLQVIITRLKHL